jgi:hypothetical protein
MVMGLFMCFHDLCDASMAVADLEKLLGGAYSLHLLPIAIPFKLQ